MRSIEESDNLKERFCEYLRKNRKRCTLERLAVLDMSQKIHGHFTADTMGELLRASDFPIAGATVYSSLELLVSFGYLVRQRFGNQACLYEQASTSAANKHHHLICTSCGKIKEVRDPVFARQIESRRFPGFSQSYYTLNIYGVCGSCTKKRKRQNEKSI